MPIQLEVKGHLLIPFGGPKVDIDKIRIAGVSTTSTYFESKTPLVYINRNEKNPLRLSNVEEVFPEAFPVIQDSEKALDAISGQLRNFCKVETDFERRFLDLYFKFLRETVTPSESRRRYYGNDELPAPVNNFDWIFEALLPLPQAHLYLKDPFAKKYSFVPAKMVRVDFAFWTGDKIVVVEIDGGVHTGNEYDVKRDRMLRRAGVEVIHILNDELSEHGVKAISKLLPDDILEFWKGHSGKYILNPLGVPF